MKKIWGFLGWIFSIVLALILFFLVYENRVLSYSTTTPYQIYDSDAISESQKISLFKNDSIKIKENVYLTTFSIWNTGSAEIEPEDIRDEVVIKIIGIKEIIDYSIIKVVESKPRNFDLQQNSSNSFILNWEHFDPKEGIKLQVIYTGDDEVIGKVEGKIYKAKIKDYNDNIIRNPPMNPVFIFLISIGILGGTTFLSEAFRDERVFGVALLSKTSISKNGLIWLRKFIILLGLLVLFGAVLYVILATDVSTKLPF